LTENSINEKEVIGSMRENNGVKPASPPYNRRIKKRRASQPEAGKPSSPPKERRIKGGQSYTFDNNTYYTSRLSR